MTNEIDPKQKGNGIDWEKMGNGDIFYATFVNGWFEHNFFGIDCDFIVTKNDEDDEVHYDMDADNLTTDPQVVFNSMVDAINVFAKKHRLGTRAKVIGR